MTIFISIAIFLIIVGLLVVVYEEVPTSALKKEASLAALCTQCEKEIAELRDHLSSVREEVINLQETNKVLIGVGDGLRKDNAELKATNEALYAKICQYQHKKIEKTTKKKAKKATTKKAQA